MIIEFFGRLHHAGPSGAFDHVELVQNARNGGGGNASLLGDSVEIHDQRLSFPHRRRPGSLAGPFYPILRGRHLMSFAGSRRQK